MASPPEQIAQALLAKALALSVTTADGRTLTIRGGRTGEGGAIPETPYVEIGDAGWQFQSVAAGYGQDHVTGRFAVIFYRQYAKEVDREKEELREFFWAFREAMRGDPELGGLVHFARVAEARVGLAPREGRHYWYWMTIVEVVFEA